MSEMDITEYIDTMEYIVTAGSWMYGTNVPTSDKDYRGFFIPSKEELYGFKAPRESIVKADGQLDVAFWSIQHYFRMCASANPNVIETLFTDDTVVSISGIAHQVRAIRKQFLSKRIGNTYLGYAIGNYQRVLKNRNPSDPYSYDGKDTMHLIRLVRTGNQTLRTGNLRVKRPEDREYFLRIRNNQEPWWAIEAEFLAHEENWKKIMENSPLPNEVDEEALNKTLVRLIEYKFNVYDRQ